MRLKVWFPLLIALAVNPFNASAQGRAGNRVDAWLRSSSLVRSSWRLPKGDAVVHELRDTADASQYRRVTLTWVVIPRSSAAIKIDRIDNFVPLRATYEEIARPNDVVVINGGFFGSSGVPLGLLVTQGRRVNRTAPWRHGGMLVQQNRRIEIIRRSDFRLAPTMQEVVQSMPILVWEGRIDAITPAQSTRSNRMAVALRGSEVMVVAAFSPWGQALSQYEFAYLLALPVSRGGLGVDAALGMDGGPGAYMYVPSRETHYGMGGLNHLPSAIHISVAP